MQAYRIKVSSLKTTQDKELIFVSKEQSGKQYAIPSAFGAYAKYIKEDKISDYNKSFKSSLWEILNEHELYKASKDNWNKAINKATNQ